VSESERGTLSAPVEPLPADDKGQGPPDVRGPTAPLPAGTLAAGIASLVLALGGTFAVQAAYAIWGGPLSKFCRDEGLKSLNPGAPVGSRGLKGAEGVCHVVEGLRSGPETALLLAGLVAGVVAVAVGFTTYRRMDSKRKREQSLAGAILGIQAIALALFVLFFRSSETVVAFATNFLNFTILQDSVDGFIQGAKNTLLLAFGGEVGGIIIGLVLAMLALSDKRTVRAPARVYINFFRGTPLIWQLSFFYFLVTLGLNLHDLSILGYHTKIDAFKVALIVFSLNTGAYAAEVFRAGIQSIERGQIEAARSLGLSYFQSMRYAIVPQAIRRVIPPLMNEFVILIKDTALVIVLGLLASQYEIYTFARTGYSDTFSATFFLGAAIGYLVITLPLIGLVNYVERRLRSGLVGIAGAGT
jgi:His/Glu/Gln/Arg/opine family amino acid ABC transporter permease subunit